MPARITSSMLKGPSKNRFPRHQINKGLPGRETISSMSGNASFNWQNNPTNSPRMSRPLSPPPQSEPKTQQEIQEILLDLSQPGPKVTSDFLEDAAKDAAFNRPRGPVIPEVDVDEFSENDDVSEDSINRTGRQAWGKTPSTRNRQTILSESQPQTPSPPQNPPSLQQPLFIRHEASPEVPKLNFDPTRSKELLERLPADAKKRPSTARPFSKNKVVPEGPLTARDRPAIVATSQTNQFKRDIPPGSVFPSAPEKKHLLH